MYSLLYNKDDANQTHFDYFCSLKDRLAIHDDDITDTVLNHSHIYKLSDLVALYEQIDDKLLIMYNTYVRKKLIDEILKDLP